MSCGGAGRVRRPGADQQLPGLRHAAEPRVLASAGAGARVCAAAAGSAARGAHHGASGTSCRPAGLDGRSCFTPGWAFRPRLPNADWRRRLAAAEEAARRCARPTGAAELGRHFTTPARRRLRRSCALPWAANSEHSTRAPGGGAAGVLDQPPGHLTAAVRSDN